MITYDNPTLQFVEDEDKSLGIPKDRFRETMEAFDNGLAEDMLENRIIESMTTQAINDIGKFDCIETKPIKVKQKRNIN